MRFVYLDEAGIGNPDHEPYTVVAGVMLHVDEQYESLRKYLLDMADDIVGKDRPLNFTFHAKDLWHGEKFFPRDEWALSKRLEILGHLADIPQKFELQIIYACVDRAKVQAELPAAKNSRASESRRAHLICFMHCLHQADKFMREFIPNERAFIVVEDHSDHRGLLREGARLMGDPRLREVIENDPSISWKPHLHLVDEPLFMAKSGSTPLQLSDTCAFILSRHLAGDKKVEPFAKKLEPRLVMGLRNSFFSVLPKATKKGPELSTQAPIIKTGP